MAPASEGERTGLMRSPVGEDRVDAPGHEHLREVDEFVDRYGLSHKRELFQKAALLFRDNSDEQEASYLTDEERNALSRESTHKWQQSRLLYFTIGICALGAIEQGWAQTSMNGANAYLGEAFHLATEHGTVGYNVLGWINSSMYLANAFCGSL